MVGLTYNISAFSCAWVAVFRCFSRLSVVLCNLRRIDKVIQYSQLLRADYD
jgi:hypothetical protein